MADLQPRRSESSNLRQRSTHYVHLLSVQAVGLQTDRLQLFSSALGSEGEPLPPERAGHELQLPEELRCDPADCSSGESELQPGDVQVS